MERGTRIAILLLVLSLISGCGAITKIDGQKNHAALTKEVKQPDGTVTTTHEEVTTQGASGSSTGDQEQVRVEGTSPPITTPGGFVIGSSTMTARGSASIEKSMAARWIVGILGFLLLLAGAAALYLRQPLKASIGTCAIGAGLIACALFPALALYILAGVALYAAASLWLTGWDATRFREALRATVEGVSKYATEKPEHAPTLLAKIKESQDPGDKNTVDKIKSKDNLK